MSAEEEEPELLGQKMDIEAAADIDENMSDEKAMDIALRKLVTTLGSADEETEIGIVEATYRTLHVIEDLGQRVAELEDQMERVDRDAQAARTVADRKAKQGSGTSKKDLARIKSRNELLRAAAMSRSGRVGPSSVTVGDVQQMARPDHKLYYQTVKDAWEELESDWDAFAVTENENDEKVLRMLPDQLEEALVKTVESDLGRDDLTKRLISGREERGR